MIDVIGILHEPIAVPEGWRPGDALPAPEPLEGWHVNVTPEVMARRPALEAYRVTPATLRRVWAGDDQANPVRTVALRFVDEAEAAAATEGL